MLNRKLVVAISSRALFNLDESHRIFESEGLRAFSKYQLQHEHEALEPGAAFSLVTKLLRINEGLGPDERLVEVLLLSRNTADTGLRIFNSIKHYNLDVTRAAFAGGESPYRYAKAFDADLYLSLNQSDVVSAMQDGLASATICLPENKCSTSEGALKIAFDGDAVIFSDEAERVYHKDGLMAFQENETQKANQPLLAGPFKGFLQALHQIQSMDLAVPIRTALVTARSAPAHERVIQTLRSWNIRIDESLFLGGLKKKEFLEAFGADIYFDDQAFHIDGAKETVTSAHVPYGIRNN